MFELNPFASTWAGESRPRSAPGVPRPNRRSVVTPRTAFTALAALAVFPDVASAQPTATIAEAAERSNKEIVRRAFAQWTAGGTRFFDILSDDVVWTILGEGQSAVTYRSKQAFLDRAVAPFSARLSRPLRPTVRSIHADGDTVITLFDGEAVTRDGRPYRNTYAWFFTMREGRVVEAKALLNLQAYDAVLARVRPAPRP